MNGVHSKSIEEINIYIPFNVSDRDREILKRCIIGVPKAMIGDMYGITSERVRQIEATVLLKIRSRL